VSAGGTAVDVMKNVPSLNVDIDGNVTMRNASPTIFIDGRPTTLTLDQIPADAIESVEVITNPSAKYDASGGNAGILNIVLKKNKRNGYNGNINTGIDKRGGVNGGLSLNARQDKINISLSGFTNQMRNRSTGSTDIESLLYTPKLFVNQTNQSRNTGGFIFGKAGIDWFATNRATFSANLIRVHGSFNPKDILRTDSTLGGGQQFSYAVRNTENERSFNAYGFQGAYKQLFTKAGRELTADINIFSGLHDGASLYKTNLYSTEGGAWRSSLEQRILSEGSMTNMTFQTDYITPLPGNGKLETGLRAQLRTFSNKQANYITDPATGKLVALSSANANYQNPDNVYASYLSMTRSIGNFGYQLGLRAESSDYTGELTDTKKEFTN